MATRPQLSGADFLSAWGGRSARELREYIESSMPPGNPGSYGPLTAVNLVAFLLEANGAVAGTQALTAASTVSIKSVANGRMPASVRDALNQSAETNTARRLRARRASPFAAT